MNGAEVNGSEIPQKGRFSMAGRNWLGECREITPSIGWEAFANP